jgi:hypothetical protein
LRSDGILGPRAAARDADLTRRTTMPDKGPGSKGGGKKPKGGKTADNTGKKK